MRLTYLDETAYRIGDLCDMDAADPQQLRLLRLYAVLAHAKGRATLLADVHDAWTAWRLETRPDHPNLVPFDELDNETQSWDMPYVKAIRQVASERWKISSNA